MLTESARLFFNNIYTVIQLLFLTLFFERKYSKKVIAAAACSVFFIVAVIDNITDNAASYLSSDEVNTAIFTYLMMFVDNVLIIGVFAVYLILFFKGKKRHHIIIAVLSVVTFYLSWLLFTYTFGVIMNLIVTKYPSTYEEGGFFYDYEFYILNIGVIIISCILYVIFLKSFSKKIMVVSKLELTAYTAIPLMSMTQIIFDVTFLPEAAKTNYIIRYAIIFISSISICFFTLFLLKKTSNDNRMKTEYLLTSQKISLYEENVINTNKQIEKMAKMKHDIKKYVQSIGRLIDNKNYDEAQKLCGEVSRNLKKIYTPLNTDNPLLNAIINVEQDKAETENIDFKVEIADQLTDFKGNADIISVIGNLCDNAIEYLKDIPREERNMSLKITSMNDYSAIICKNRILDSVLEKNPQLTTTKPERSAHGKGGNIVREISEKYSGSTNYSEDGKMFCVTVLMKVHK